MRFNNFGTAVAKQFQSMTTTGLFVVDVDKDLLWDTYLTSFPPGSDPVHKTKTEHDCRSCRSFIRVLGSVVTVVEGELKTIWDVKVEDEAYQVVADKMAALVRGSRIRDIFLHVERVAGVAKNRQLLEDAVVKTWEHFSCNLPKEVVVKGDDIGTKRGDAHATHGVMLRGLTEVTVAAIDTTLDLIAQNSLYRGEEHKGAVEAFLALKKEFDKAKDKNMFTWAKTRTVSPGIARLRSTAIGTLLMDLSEGYDLEDCVKSFETKVAPTNYKRPTALVTKAMVKKAQVTVDELGLTSALERRYATIEDITVNNVLFADRAARKEMSVFDELAATAGSSEESVKKLSKVEEISIEDFISKILPKAESLEIMFENRHQPNLVSLIAPVDPSAKQMFKWPNQFSWSYTGEVTDSIKERVKKAGGSVVGDLCCRLAWDYTDDLDAHMVEPGKFHIFYPNRRAKSPNGGELDLDANGADGMRADPAENIFYADRKQMKDGVYVFSVNNFCRRSGGKGFTVEIEFDGQVHTINHEKTLRDGETVTVAEIKYSRAAGFEIIKSLPSSQASRKTWNIATQAFNKVKVMMLSPNHWDEKAIGNKHYFFMLDECQNDGRARGFFNEFLLGELDQHRKVLEMVGSKMKTEETGRQLSGLGFSSTQRNSVLCRVKGSFARTVKITF